jgi:hypothetical protein
MSEFNQTQANKDAKFKIPVDNYSLTNRSRLSP